MVASDDWPATMRTYAMPHNTVHFLHSLWESLPEPIKAAILAALVAILRILYDGKEPRWVRRALEAALCGCIAMGVAYLTESLGLPHGWGVFMGAAIGLFGADSVREFGRRYISGRISQDRKR